MHPLSPSATQPITRALAGTRPSRENKWSQRSCQHYVRLYKCEAQGDPSRSQYLKATGIGDGEPLDANVFDKTAGNRKQKHLRTIRNTSTKQHFYFNFSCSGLQFSPHFGSKHYKWHIITYNMQSATLKGFYLEIMTGWMYTILLIIQRLAKQINI